jgi:predicted enzyme related to lactoylglutathione lyase
MAIEFTQEVTASLNVSDIDASIAWYQTVLGCTLLYKVEEIGWCELSTHMPGVLIGLSENQQVPAGGNAINVWGVTDIEAAVAELDRHGVRRDDEIQTIPELVRLMTFFDPDGNAMMLAQSLQGAA